MKILRAEADSWRRPRWATQKWSLGNALEPRQKKEMMRSVLKQIQDSVIYSTWVAFIVQYCRPGLSRNPWWNRGGLISTQHDTMCAPGSSPRSSWLVPSIEGAKDHCTLILRARIMECIWWSMPCHAIGGVWALESKYKDQVKYESDWIEYIAFLDKSVGKGFHKSLQDKQFSGRIYFDEEKIQVTGDWHSRSWKTCWCSYPNKRSPIRKSGIFYIFIESQFNPVPGEHFSSCLTRDEKPIWHGCQDSPHWEKTTLWIPFKIIPRHHNISRDNTVILTKS